MKLNGPDLRPEQFPHDMACRFRRQQLRRTIEQMRIMLACNTFFAPVLSAQAWNSGINGLVLAWTAAIIAFSWWLFFGWKRTYLTQGSAADMRRFVAETAANASFWAVGMAIFYPVVEGEQKAVVSAVMAGSLALGTVGFSQAPSAAFAYMAVLTFGNCIIALICGLADGTTEDYLIAFLSLAAGASVFNATLERGRSLTFAFKNHEQLSEKSEVVDLLLKDYEKQATEWLWQTDSEGKIIRAPDQILHLLGATQADLAQASLVEMISNASTEEAEEDAQRLRQAFAQHEEFHDIRLSMVDPSTGETRWILIKGRPQSNADMFRGFRGIFADATVSVVAEKKVKFSATFDSLTKLYNRNSTQKRLTDLLPRKDNAAAFLIDLDGFKQVNDSYGHLAGDKLLQAAADRLRRSVPEGAFAARLGGDEFFVLLTSDTPFEQEETDYIADRIVDGLSRPFQVDEFYIQISSSVGITSFPDDTEIGPDLLTLADLALYKAKNDGRDRFEYFHTDMQDALNEKIALTERLKLAVESGSIRPHYQSQHALADGRLIGFEALARWHDAELGAVRPDIFIPIAEQTGLIASLGEQLLRKACADAALWAKTLGAQAPVLSVNFSPVQFARMDMATLVARVLEETGYPAHLLEVEITEGVLISNKALIAETLNRLSQMGVSVALDDFGTGYSSLSYLKELPLHRLKIDRSFVCDLDETTPNPIVDSVIKLGHSLGLSVIAEGIEDQVQIDRLIKMGCDDGQGYFYSRALTSQDAHRLVIEINEAPARQNKTAR